jgi:hypothetical protein
VSDVNDRRDGDDDEEGEGRDRGGAHSGCGRRRSAGRGCVFWLRVEL